MLRLTLEQTEQARRLLDHTPTYTPDVSSVRDGEEGEAWEDDLPELKPLTRACCWIMLIALCLTFWFNVGLRLGWWLN